MLDFSGSAVDDRSDFVFSEPIVSRVSVCCVTEEYHAPELRSSSTLEVVDSRVDVYSCGVMFCKLLNFNLKNWRDDAGSLFLNVFQLLT